MLNQIKKRFYPSKRMADFPISSNLRSVLPAGFERYADRLHPLGRASFPLFSESQVCKLVRTAQQVGDTYLTNRLAENLLVRLADIEHIDEDPYAWTFAKPRTQIIPDVLQEHLKLAYFCKDAVSHYRNPEIYYELVDLAHTWMEWKARAVIWPDQVSREVVTRAHWNFVHYLLTMEFPFFNAAFASD